MHQLAHTHPSRCGQGGGRWWEGQKQLILANGVWTAQDGLLVLPGKAEGYRPEAHSPRLCADLNLGLWGLGTRRPSPKLALAFLALWAARPRQGEPSAPGPTGKDVHCLPYKKPTPARTTRSACFSPAGLGSQQPLPLLLHKVLPRGHWLASSLVLLWLACPKLQVSAAPQ